MFGEDADGRPSFSTTRLEMRSRLMIRPPSTRLRVDADADGAGAHDVGEGEFSKMLDRHRGNDRQWRRTGRRPEKASRHVRIELAAAACP